MDRKQHAKAAEEQHAEMHPPKGDRPRYKVEPTACDCQEHHARNGERIIITREATRSLGP